ncbi:MAG TPA: tetratricopeptide repeat protein [Gemmatimonadaceae bacterium]
MDRPVLAHRPANRLELFGGAVVHAAHAPITGRAAQRHRIALLALLSTTRRLHRTRDQLVFFLWPEADTERGRKLLSDSIYRINQALGGDAITGAGEDLRLNRDQLASDVADFEAAVESRDWRRVAELYAGPFLDGFFLSGAADFDQWMENERAHYARAAARAIEALAVDARGAGRVAEAVDWWQRLAVLVPDDSRVAMELMRALEASGNRAGALRHSRLHMALLRETLGVEPDRSFRELADRIARRTEPSISVEMPAVKLESPVVTAAASPRGHDSNKGGELVAPVSNTGQHGSSIAVLPFSNVSDSDTNAYFADGVSEELMYLLTRTSGLRVASRTSSFAYRDIRLDVREVARRLQVDWILEGSVRRSGDKLRIVAQLTDAKNGYQVWSESFDRTSNDIFAIQAEIAGAIVERLAPNLGDAFDGMFGGASVAGARRALDPEVYDLYLQARFEWHRRTEESLRKSAALFEEVVARDPRYARAWAGLAEAYAVIAFYDYLAPRVAFPRADSAARHAILLDPNLAAPYATLAYVDTYYHWNWVAAEQGFRRALELEPTSATAHQWYANFLTGRGRFDEAEHEMRRAAELDPLSMIAHSAIGWALIFANRTDRAIQQLQSALQLDSTYQVTHFWMALALEQAGRPAEAIPHLHRVLELSHGCTLRCSLTLAALARAHAATGNPDAARAVLNDLIERESAGVYVSSYDIGKVYLSLGDVSTALTRLERAFTDRAHSMALLRIDPQLRSLANNPRFQKLVERVEEPMKNRELQHYAMAG